MTEQRFKITDLKTAQNAGKALRETGYSVDKPVELLIRPYVERRSEAQRRTLWGWFYKNLETALNEGGIIIEDDDGHEWPYTKEILHDMFKEYFLCYGEIKRKGKVRRLYWSTNDLPKSRSNNPLKPTFSEYIQKIKDFSYQHWEIDLEDPVSGLMKSYWDECA